MRIVSRDELMQIKEPVLYADCYEGWGIYGDLCVKWESCEPFTNWDPLDMDFCMSSLIDIECDGSDEMHDLLEKMDESSSFEVDIDPAGSGREGLFDKNKRYVVFSKKDVKRLIDTLKVCTGETTYRDLEYDKP